MDISEIKADRYFWGVQCYANAAGEWSALEIFNPVGSNVLLAVTDIELWCSQNMQYRLVSHNVPLPKYYGPRNSLYWPASGPTTSVCEMRGQLSGLYPGGNNLRVLSNGVYTFDRPWVIGEGRGVRIIPDSTAAYSWCGSMTFAEFPA